MVKKEYFDFVNIAKLILAIAVVAMHCTLIPDTSIIMWLVCRLAVPYFFVASGFFLKKKTEDNPKDAVKGYIKRLMLPYIVFSIVWIIQFVIDNAIEGIGFKDSIPVLIQNILFFPRGALWYVWASIIGVIMLYPFIKKRKLPIALPTGIALFAIGLLANNYYFIADSTAWLKPIVDGYLSIFLVSNNALFVGFVFLLLGMLLCEYYEMLQRKIGVKFWLMILIISGVLLGCEVMWIQKQGNSIGDGAFYLSQLIYVPTVFFLTTRVKCPHLSRSLINTTKWLSTGIYFLHVPILWIIHRTATYVFPHIPGLSKLSPLFDHAGVCFLSCLVLCVAICLIAYRFPKSFICKILK